MRRAFVDTSAFYAHVDQNDKFHARASSLLRQATRENWDLYTTSANIYESYTLILRELGQPSVAIGFLDRIKAGFCEVVRMRSANPVADDGARDPVLVDVWRNESLERSGRSASRGGRTVG